MVYGRRTWYLYLDPDLKLVHTRRDCADARVAVKYNTIRSVELLEGDEAGAAELFSRTTRCLTCTRWEAGRPASHVRPPGFREGQR